VRWGREAFGLWFTTRSGRPRPGDRRDQPARHARQAREQGRPFPALTATVVEPKTGTPITEAGRVGLIAVRPPWPSLMRTYWNNTATYYGKFLNGWYIAATRASLDSEATSGSAGETTT